MMNFVLFGVGAAGNKAAIEVIESRVMAKEKVKLVNTTVKDIPADYKDADNIIKFSSMLGGCGKEPNQGKRAMFQAIKDKTVDLAKYIEGDTRAVILVTSIEGGTGCGATPVIAKYFMALNIPVHVYAFVGFQDEVRGINNSLQFFKSLPENVILHTIENGKFLDYTKNYSKAEQAANKEFADQLNILIGSDMIPSTQNIDDTDHYKLITTPGYMDIHSIDLTGCKNTDLVNQAIIDSFESMTCMEYPTGKGCKRLAVIINASSKTQEAIDNKFEVVKRYTGEPFEVYRHIQYDEDDRDEYMYIIAAGLPYPANGILEMNKEYLNLTDKLNKESAGFGDLFDDIDLDDEEDTKINSMRNPDAILAGFTLDDEDKELQPRKATTVNGNAKNNKMKEY